MFFEGRRWLDPTSPGGHKSTSSHYDQVFGLTQIPQVVMNIDYKLEPIADKNVAAYFHDLDFDSYVKLLYHSKISISLQICAFLGFIKDSDR